MMASGMIWQSGCHAIFCYTKKKKSIHRKFVISDIVLKNFSFTASVLQIFFKYRSNWEAAENGVNLVRF